MHKAFFGGACVSAIAIVTVFASCGGKVVVDGPGDGQGGAGGTGNGQQQSSSQDVGSGASGNAVVATAAPGSGPDTSVGPGTTGAGGGAPSDQCEQCLDKVADDVCEPQIAACEDNPVCEAHLDCLESCDFTYDCEAKCNEMFPSMEWFDLVNCVVCGNCLDACFDFSLAQYCLDH
jgi:hypothetical protein